MKRKKNSMRDFYLMHKDVPCGFLTIDETSGNIISYKDAGNGFSPFLGNSDLDKSQLPTA